MEPIPSFDAVQFGRLIQSVNNLNESLNLFRTELNSSISTIQSDVDSLKATRDKGWGILTGVGLVAGGLGSASHAWIDKLFK